MKFYKSILVLACINLCIAACTKKDAGQIPGPPQQNHAPVANAGADQTVLLPYNNTTILDADESTDPDSNIKTYLWKKVSGPSSVTIALPNNKRTQITDLVEGTYEFELTVTDAGGLSSTDKILVTVKVIFQTTGCLIPGATQVANFQDQVADAPHVICKGKLYFLTGLKMYIFDPVANLLTSEPANIGRVAVAASVSGDIIFFAGGYNLTNSGSVIPSSKVDIYNTVSKTWSAAKLSKPRYNITALALDNKVFFAGGNSDGYNGSPRIDIYHTATNTWSQYDLPSEGIGLATTLNNKLWLFSANNKIHIYDIASDTWESKSINLPAIIGIGYKSAAIFLNNKMYITGSQTVAVYDITSDNWSSISLSENKTFIPAGISNNKIAFIGGMTRWFMYSKLIEIYDPATNSWSTQYMTSDLFYQSIISYDNYIYSAGGLADEENTNIYSICRFQL